MLHIHRAERADALAGALATILARPLEDPFATEVVAVPTRGMERWLTQRLSIRLGARSDHGDGICAGVAFPSPRGLVSDALSVASGIDVDEDRWPAQRLTWPLLSVVDGCLGEPWLAQLSAHLEQRPRLATVRHLAELYDHYAIRRPEMVLAWAAGENTDGAAAPLPQDGVWQAELWRRVREAIGTPSPPERLAPACEALRAEPDVVALPPRLALFGITRLPAAYLEVLGALAAAREVHVFVLHPSPVLWDRVAAVMADAPAVRGAGPRRSDPTASLPENRILASWGQDARELQLVLAAAPAEAAVSHEPVAAAPDSLLGRLQNGIRRDARTPVIGERSLPDLDPDDHSVQIHACHGRARQVEVLRDAILHELAEDPTLEPRDVIVMCPDVETMAPLIQAAFGAGRAAAEPGGDGADTAVRLRLPDLRVRLADRSLRQTNPILGTVDAILGLAGGRVTASGVLDLIDRDPVRRRFGFDDDDVARLQEWVVATGTHWGLDAEHRAPFRLEVIDQGTWRHGLDRVLTGVAMSEEGARLLAGTLPLDDVDSGAIDLAGRFAELLARLALAVEAMSGMRPLAEWVEAITAAADGLTATPPHESWQRSELSRVLEGVGGDAGVNAPQLTLADMRGLLGERLRGRPTRANFRTGHLTVCTLHPMRSVPHRIVCLLGLDDGEFPRKAPRDGDDLLLREPRLGDRDPRSEDRQMLLDALLAAREKLIVTFTGHDERTNLPRPPAVPVGELLDAVDRTVSVPAGAARDRVLVHHPLQPADPRNFEAGRLRPGPPWSFDGTALAGARALCAPREGGRPFLTGPLPPRERAVIALDDLVRFVEHPVRAFLRQRLGISVSERDDEVSDALPVELDGLGRWGVGQRLLEAVLGGTPLVAAVAAERARGSLPPGQLGEPLLAEICPIVERIAACAAEQGSGDPRSLDVHVALADGRRLAGTVSGVRGETLRRVSFSRLRPKDRLTAWIRLLALTAARPEVTFRAAVVGRGGGRASAGVAVLPALGESEAERAQAAMAELATVVDIYDRGMREPLPLACDASAAYAEAALRGRDAESAGREKWESDFRFDREDRNLEHLLAFGRQLSFAELASGSPALDETGPAWPADEPTRFGRYALRLWAPLLRREGMRET